MPSAKLKSRSVRRRPSDGMTLIEVCAVMAANAILVAVILSALYALGRADRSYATRVEKLRGVSELSNQLREDLHAAQSLAWNDAGELSLVLPDEGLVVYARQNDRWERRTRPSDDAAASQPEQNGTPGAGYLTAAFRVPSQLKATITPATATVGAQIHVVWRAEHDADRDRPSLPTPPELSVTLGRDERVLHE